MTPELKVDKISPPPARLSAFLYHTPHILPSLLLFVSTTLLLVFGSHSQLKIAADTPEYALVAFSSFAIPIISVSYLVTQISWLWDGRYPLRYGLQAGSTGSVLMLITLYIASSFDEADKGLVFGLGCMSGLWYLTLRTHGSAPARVAFPLSLISPISTLYFLNSGEVISDTNLDSSRFLFYRLPVIFFLILG